MIALFKSKSSEKDDFKKILKDYREKTYNLLSSTFGLSRNDCEEIFQEASIILYQQITEGKLDNLQHSLYTYFVGICKNKAHEALRKKGRFVNLSFEIGTKCNEVNMDKVEDILYSIEDNESRRAEKQLEVQKVVASLPHPCNELLWAYYRDSLTVKEMTKMFGYASESALKVTKHRCCEKFRKRFSELKTIF